MSVEIFDVETREKCSGICIPVAGENTFNTIWECALKELNIYRLGNGVWLQRKDLEQILSDFCRIKEWAEQHLPTTEADDVVNRINDILEELPSQWSKNPYITQLWMG